MATFRKEKIAAARVTEKFYDKFEAAAATEQKSVSEKLRELMAAFIAVATKQ